MYKNSPALRVENPRHTSMRMRHKSYLNRIGGRARCHASKGLAGGFSLVEVLITVFVLSIGLLGIAGLQILSKQSTSEAIQRTTASFLTHDITERMRSNPTALNSYVGKTVGNGTIQTEPSPDCRTATCTDTQMAAHDLWEWEQALDGAAETTVNAKTGGLFQPTGCIIGPLVGGSALYTITIVWRGKSALTNGNAANTCGTTALYGSAMEFRRILFTNSFIANK